MLIKTYDYTAQARRSQHDAQTNCNATLEEIVRSGTDRLSVGQLRARVGHLYWEGDLALKQVIRSVSSSALVIVFILITRNPFVKNNVLLGPGQLGQSVKRC